MINLFDDVYFLKEALKEAKIAFEEDEVPVGAVIVINNRIVARAHNQTEKLNDFTAHAEMLAFTAAAEFFNKKYLDECTLYVTIEPCPMCAGAAFWTQIKSVVFGANDPRRGSLLFTPQLFHPSTTVKGGVLDKECAALLSSYFKNKRNSKH